MPDPNDHISGAQAYVTASNAHDLAAIAPLLEEDCRYVSSGVGEHRGKSAILDMMQGFFAANPDVHWDVAQFRLKTADCVVFDFTITLGGHSSTGVEQISFGESGKISLIEVAR